MFFPQKCLTSVFRCEELGAENENLKGLIEAAGDLDVRMMDFWNKPFWKIAYFLVLMFNFIVYKTVF